MKMYHPRFKGTHYEMGRKLGNVFKTCNAQFPIKLDQFQIQFGRESGKLLKKFFPGAAEEIRGITDAIEYDNELFTSWMMCMGCCMYNLDEMDSVELRGCTAFSFVHNGHVYYGRDNDLPSFLKKISKSEYYKPDNGNSFILNTSSFINGEEGINEYGLTAAMTFVMPKLEEIKPGLNSVFLVRYILEKCKTVDEAIEALKKLPIASSCNILLTDKSGKMTVAECNPLKMNFRYPEKNENGENFIVTVNHFTSEGMWKHDAGSRDVYSSAARYQTAYNALKNRDYKNGVEHAENLLKGKYGFMCQYDKGLNFDTVWSSVFDITNNRIYRAEGNPFKTKYIEDKRMNFNVTAASLL
jgi:predicted choloylglycine hydrolase